MALAEKFQGSAVRFEHLAEQLAEADIVISSTGAQGYVIDAEMARQAERARKGRPMFLIDIAVPRDVDPQVNQLSNIYCYDVDDLQQVAEDNKSEREQEALSAQRIVEDEVARFVRWKHSDAVKPVLKALRQHFAATGEQELDKLLGRLKHLPESDAKALRGLVQSLVNKLLHLPSTNLRNMGEDLNGQMYAQALQELFGLAPDASDDTLQPAAGEARSAAGSGERNVVPFRAAGSSKT